MSGHTPHSLFSLKVSGHLEQVGAQNVPMLTSSLILDGEEFSRAGVEGGRLRRRTESNRKVGWGKKQQKNVQVIKRWGVLQAIR